MPLTIDQIIASAAADNDYLMVTSSDDIYYAHVNTERLTDTVATIASAVLGKADAIHTHNNYATTDHTHDGYASADHTHSNYATTTELDAVVDDLEFFIDTKANAYHDHDLSDITGLEDALDDKADVSDLNTKADLINGLVPASQLPSFVDDVLEYTALANFPTEGETGKIYVDQTTNKVYRWSGTAYVEISASLALGETASTAYRGDRGATAYSHSQNGDVHVTAAQKAAWNAKSDFSGSYDDLTDKPTIPEVYTHPTSHPASMITGLSTVATSGSYNDLANKPTIPTIPASLPANGGNADTVDNKHASDFATATHGHSYNDLSDKPTIPSAYTHPASHPASMITGLSDVATSGSYNDLSDKPTIPSAYTHPASHPASMITGLANVATSGSYNDLTNKPTIPSAYTHPSYTAKSSGLYKVTVDATGHVSAATAVTKADITALGIPESDTNTTYSAATTSSPGLMSASDKSKLNGIAVGANAYVLPTATSSVLGGVKTGSNITNSSGTISLTKANVTAALGYTPPTSDTTYSAASTSAAGLMSATDKAKLDGIAEGANKITVDSALSSSSTNPVQNKVINTALAGKAASSHTHTLSAITGLLGLLATDDDGDVKVSWSDQDVVAKIKALGSGIHTAYAKGGTTNNPKTTESWRFIVHKTGTANYGWVIAFGSSGSVYTGYVDNASWKGWKCLYNATSNDMILWSGSAYMQSTNSTPQVVTPSKKLSECRAGWMLLWSDYDPGEGANDTDFCTTFIPKYTPSGGTWGGKAFYCDIPLYVGGDATDLSTEKRCIKPVYVHDNCLKGSYQNTSGGRNDVVLRAVYEV